MLPFVLSSLTCLILLLGPRLAAAQDVSRRLEVGLGFAGLEVETDPGRATYSPGLSAVVAWWTADRLALESQLSWFPRSEPLRYRAQGGQSLHLAGGVRATFLDRPRWSMYGRMLPGIVHFSDTATSPGTRGSATAFALAYGAGLQVRVTPSLAVRVDGSRILLGFNRSPCDPPSPGGGPQACLIISGNVVDIPLTTIALTHSFSRGRPRPPESVARGRWEAGAQLTSQTFTYDLVNELRREAGFAVFASYEVFRSLDLDGMVGLLPRSLPPALDAGGRVVQALAGVKVGTRHGRLGAFAKIRGGVVRYGNAASSVDSRMLPPEIGYSSRRAGAVDLGGVLSFSLGSRGLIRIDAGDLIIPAREVPYALDGEVAQLPVDLKHTLAFAVGLGWRP